VTGTVDISNVSKRFRLYHGRPDSLKERVISLGRIPYEDFWALNDVSFHVDEGETMGLLGHNGSGKSTLLKCVAGILRPTSGTITTRGRLAALLELGAGFHPDLTGRENVYLNGSILGFSRAEIDGRFDEIVAFSELDAFIDQQVKHYSSGMYARLGFAVAVNVDPDVLLVDEVLAVGDEAFQRKCLDRVRRFQREGRTVFFVTHAADLVRQICDRAAVLDHGRLVTVASPPEAINEFRQTLLARGIDIPDGAAAGPKLFTGEVAIRDVVVVYPGGADHVTSGSPLTIAVTLEASEPVDDCVVALTIHDQDGNRLLGANTELLGLDIGRVDGHFRVAFDLQRVSLLDGIYLVSVGAHSRSGERDYDQWAQKGSFTVVNPGRVEGLVDFSPRARVMSDPSPEARVSRESA
jgi:ABC-2 type transport system ATP-binding protein